MNDKDILLRLLQQAYSDDLLTQAAKKEYERITSRITGMCKENES